jgi:hypothetical protein
MLRAILTLLSVLLSSWGFAQKSGAMYQVDMIVFTHQHPATAQLEHGSTPLLSTQNKNWITLEDTVRSTMTPYHTLPSASSMLKNEYWALNRKPEYHVLFHYTWLQPNSNQQFVSLPSINKDGWNIEGLLRIKRSNYFLLDTELLFSQPNNDKSTFVFNQKQRLKPEVVYYLDHPQAGMLIKVHQIA